VVDERLRGGALAALVAVPPRGEVARAQQHRERVVLRHPAQGRGGAGRAAAAAGAAPGAPAAPPGRGVLRVRGRLFP
jgi:hypothetical protein